MTHDDDVLYQLLTMPTHIQQVAMTLADDLADRLRSETPTEKHLECYSFVLRELLDSHRKRGGFGAEPVPLS